MLAVLGDAKGRPRQLALVSSVRKADSTTALVWPVAAMTSARKSITPTSILVILPECWSRRKTHNSSIARGIGPLASR
jgi:hypothetical protein